MGVVLTCEHGGNRIPPRYARLFAGSSRLLASHRGHDPGALAVARALARAWAAPLLAATTTRLLVDPNRSARNPAVFSALTRALPREERDALLARLHAPHWARVREALDAAASPVLHLAVHSFTPVLHGETRRYDVGLLYDPARRGELTLARRWQRCLRGAGLRVRRNAPYRGAADGLTTALRRERPARRYLGIELELNQRALATRAGRRAVVAALSALPH
jgi:predicted N-formylglutamate amidohydrolase